MPNASRLISSLHQKGVKIWIEDSRLRFQAPKGSLLPSDLQELKDLKSELAEILTQAQILNASRIHPRDPVSPIPLPEIYIRYLRQLFEEERGLSSRINVTSIRITGALDIDILRECISSVVNQHESLRTRFAMTDNIPVMQVSPMCAAELEIVRLSREPETFADKGVMRLAQDLVDQKMHLSTDPLFCFKLLNLSDNDHVLISAFNPLISDGHSLDIINQEIWHSYDTLARGIPLRHPGRLIQFADYFSWLHNTYDIWKERNESYWINRLTDLPTAQIPTDYPATEKPPAAAVEYIHLGETLSARIRELARRERILSSMVLLSVHVIIMSRWCNQHDVLIRLVSDGRFLSELKNVTGCVVDMLHLRIDLKHGETFLELLRQVNDEFYSAACHRDFQRIPFIIPSCNTDLYFNWMPTNWEQHLITQQFTPPDHIRFSPFHFVPRLPIRYDTLKFDPSFHEAANGITVMVRYRTDYLAPSTIARFGRTLRLLATEFVQHPEARIDSISVNAAL